MPKFLITILSVLTISFSFAQHEAQASLFWNYYTHFNPAMAGLQYQKAANVLWRNQWTAVNGAPTTIWGNYAQKADKIHGAIGASYSYDRIGFINTHNALATYAFHLPVKNMIFSFGASAGIIAMNTSPTWAGSGKSYPAAFSGDLGIAVHHEKWNAGFSVTNVNSPKIKDRDGGYFFDYTPYFHLHGDYTFDLGPKWNITPGFHVFSDKIKMASTQYVKATYNEKLWFGVNSWNWITSFGFMAGYDFKEKFRVGYSFELNKLIYLVNIDHNYNHEIVLSYLIK